VALATSAPGLHLYAIDLSSPALWVSQVNAERHGVADRITFLNGDLLTSLPASVDLIVSNPPYVAENEWSLLPSSVKREPTLALLGGPDGLNPLRDLLLQSGAHLRAGGLLLAEIGERQGAASLELARAAFPGAHCSVLPDLSGKDRVLKVRLE
jgi:release factor glutamine methyltransferase